MEAKVKKIRGGQCCILLAEYLPLSCTLNFEFRRANLVSFLFELGRIPLLYKKIDSVYYWDVYSKGKSNNKAILFWNDHYQLWLDFLTSVNRCNDGNYDFIIKYNSNKKNICFKGRSYLEVIWSRGQFRSENVETMLMKKMKKIIEELTWKSK